MIARTRAFAFSVIVASPICLFFLQRVATIHYVLFYQFWSPRKTHLWMDAAGGFKSVDSGILATNMYNPVATIWTIISCLFRSVPVLPLVLSTKNYAMIICY